MALNRFDGRAVALAFPIAALLAACSSTSSGNGADGGGDAAAIVTPDGGTGDDTDASPPPADAGPVTCSPANVQSYSPHWTPAKPHTSSCTAAQISSYAQCLESSDPSSAACAPWLGADASANSSCRTCFTDSSSTDSSWGPIVDIDSVRQINVAGCMALVSGDTGGTGCAGQYQALQGCESAACATNCTNASTQNLRTCVSQADNAGCSNYLAPAACVNDAGAADVCFGPQGTTFAQLFTAVATVFCLADGDAGDGG